MLNESSLFQAYEQCIHVVQKDQLSYKEKADLARSIYEYTKTFLQSYKDILTPLQKGEVLRKYIDMWRTCRFKMDILQTEYAKYFEKSTYGKRNGDYYDGNPMMAGFNLQGARLGNLCRSDLIFLFVNFSDADFTDTGFPYAHFEKCDLREIKTKNSNLNQTKYIGCKLQGADFNGTGLCESSFKYCDLSAADFKSTYFSWTNFEDCNLLKVKFPPGRISTFNCANYIEPKKCLTTNSIFKSSIDTNNNSKQENIAEFSLDTLRL